MGLSFFHFKLWRKKTAATFFLGKLSPFDFGFFIWMGCLCRILGYKFMRHREFSSFPAPYPILCNDCGSHIYTNRIVKPFFVL